MYLYYHIFKNSKYNWFRMCFNYWYEMPFATFYAFTWNILYLIRYVKCLLFILYTYKHDRAIVLFQLNHYEILIPKLCEFLFLNSADVDAWYGKWQKIGLLVKYGQKFGKIHQLRMWIERLWCTMLWKNCMEKLRFPDDWNEYNENFKNC